MTTQYIFFCAELKETLKIKDNSRSHAFKCANEHFKPLFESSGLKFVAWYPDPTKMIMTAKIEKKFLQY